MCLKNGSGCFAIGLNYKNGLGVKKDYLKGKEYDEKACDLNDAYGCYFMGLYYKNALLNHDLFKAKKYFEKACNLKLNNSCKEYAKLN